MHEALENTLVRTLVLSTKELSWAIEGRELLINGRLFDVKEVKQASNGSWEVKGLYDTEETELLDLVRKKFPDENGHQLIGKLIRLQLIIPENFSDFFTRPTALQNNWNTDLPGLIPQAHQRILVPPPKAVL